VLYLDCHQSHGIPHIIVFVLVLGHVVSDKLLLLNTDRGRRAVRRNEELNRGKRCDGMWMFPQVFVWYTVQYCAVKLIHNFGKLDRLAVIL